MRAGRPQTTVLSHAAATAVGVSNGGGGAASDVGSDMAQTSLYPQLVNKDKLRPIISAQAAMIGGPRTLNCSCTPRKPCTCHTRTAEQHLAAASSGSGARARPRARTRGRAEESSWALQVLGQLMPPPEPRPPSISTFNHAASLTAGASWYCTYRARVSWSSMAYAIPPAVVKHAVLEAILNLNLDLKDERGHSFFDFFSSLLFQCTEEAATTTAVTTEELAVELWNRFPGRHKSLTPLTYPSLVHFTLLAQYRNGADWYEWYKPVEEVAMSNWLAHVGHNVVLCLDSCQICEAYSRIFGG